jgi:radical SAM superfamily enzyme YgiQ (UPF0313 family)
MARVLLSSVFKPFGVDGLYSRRDSKIELYHNQLTKYQGAFSLRSNMLSYGLHVIADNIGAEATVLEFPTLERFKKEVKKGYDYVGIGSIAPNFEKVKRMAHEVREISPGSKIVIGGFCATIENLRERLDVDYVCVGEGISFMRELLGEPSEHSFRSPLVFSEVREMFGVPLLGAKTPHIPVGLGCPYGCDFCHPSHFFGKKHIKYFSSGRALFDEMVRTSGNYGSEVISFIGDDNFLADLKRAQELRDAVVESGRLFRIFLFASADAIERFGVEALAEMGAFKVWIGRESSISPYKKNKGVDLDDLVGRLHRHGIKVILSSILLLDEHTGENVLDDIGEHLACRPDFSQFSFYSPAAGTPLWDRLKEEGRLLDGIPFEEMHAFKQPWFTHPHFTLMQAEHLQETAYLRDYYELGPSIMRWIETDLEGYLFMRDSENDNLKRRAELWAGPMPRYRVLLRAIERLAPSEHIRERSREIRSRVESEFGRIRACEEAMAVVLSGFGRVREWRTEKFGDDIQPRTRVFRYP